ncbi:MAG: hypothetical protein ACYTFG_09270, partial [Planctomycetota bacterium]
MRGNRTISGLTVLLATLLLPMHLAAEDAMSRSEWKAHIRKLRPKLDVLALEMRKKAVDDIA